MTFARWFQRKWQTFIIPEVEQAYRVTFSTPHGQLVLQHMLDNVYCTVYDGFDPIACITHNARRTLVHEIIEAIDRGENPAKYAMKVEE